MIKVSILKSPTNLVDEMFIKDEWDINKRLQNWLEQQYINNSIHLPLSVLIEFKYYDNDDVVRSVSYEIMDCIDDEVNRIPLPEYLEDAARRLFGSQ